MGGSNTILGFTHFPTIGVHPCSSAVSWRQDESPLTHGGAWRTIVALRVRAHNIIPSWLLPTAATALLVIVATAGCTITETRERAPAAAPPPTFLGPPFFRGTVGSMAILLDYEPLLVSGYGIVVGLDDTGSSEVPPLLRQTLINQMRKMGVGSISMVGEFPELARMSPERLLSRKDTAIVGVQGFIPPGAVRGTRFDVLISAWPQTQTTNLAGGQLWQVDMAPGQLENPREFLFKQAQASGPIYMSPFDDRYTDQPKRAFLRQAIVIKGGQVTEDRPITLALNQPSWQRSRAIANRINERFGLATDAKPIASPETDRIINLWIPPRWAGDPGELLAMIGYLYIQTGPGFEAVTARRLTRELVRQPSFAPQITVAWQTLGRTALGVLRESYDSDNLTLRQAALEAGAYLGDALAGESLAELAANPDPQVRIAAARSLSHLTRSEALFELLSDEDRTVRIAAYEALTKMNSRLVERTPIFDKYKQLKFVIDRIPSEKPLVYVSQVGVPRIALFGDHIGFATPEVGRAWDNRLMIRTTAPDAPASLFYQPPRESSPQTVSIVPTLPTLIYYLAHYPTLEQPEPGLNLPYSEVVDAVYHLCESRFVQAPLELNLSPLAKLIDEYERGADSIDRRPEFVDPADRGEISVQDPEVTTDEWTIRSETADPGATNAEVMAVPAEEPDPPAMTRPETDNP